jgi:hypothetical protein
LAVVGRAMAENVGRRVVYSRAIRDIAKNGIGNVVLGSTVIGIIVIAFAIGTYFAIGSLFRRGSGC